jgi:hypothetical protein
MTEDKFVFSTNTVEKVRQKFEDGYKISRQEKYWFSNLPMVRRSGLVFSFTDDELLEYSKCKFGIDEDGMPLIDSDTQTLKQSGIQYFSEKYCMIKNEEGKISNMRLRDYQNDILDLYTDNRFSILAGSRQIGKCLDPLETVNINGIDIHIYEIWYSNLNEKTVFDRLKHTLYNILKYLS